MRHQTIFSVLVCAFAIGCASTPYVWIADVPTEQVGQDYVIASGDVLSVRVFNQDPMSTRARVRSDGKIAVPFLGDVAVRGQTPATVSKALEVQLKAFVVSPVVTVTVEEMQPTSVSVLGEVTRPGIYTVDASSGVLQALAAAGGLTEYASRGGIYVVRRDPPQHIRFGFGDLTTAPSHAATFRLRTGDVVVVE
jgi:polysaccharide export outer membrane protein